MSQHENNPEARETSSRRESTELSYRCPYCQGILTEARGSSGQKRLCRHCGKESIVPRPKLSFKGDFPVGIKIETVAPPSKERLSISGNPPLQSSACAGPESRAAPTPPRSSRRLLHFAGVLLVLALAALFVYRAKLKPPPPPPTAATAKPGETVVFSKLEFACQSLLKAEMSQDIVENDRLQLEMVRKIADKDNPMTFEITTIEGGIAKRRETIQRDLALARDTVAELASYHRQWSEFIRDLFAQKVKEAENARNENKAAWLAAIAQIVEKAPPDEQAAREHINKTIQLKE